MNVQAQLFHWRKLFWLGVAASVAMGGDIFLTKYGPGLRAAAIETGASFSVSAGSFPTEAKASTFAAALDASGLPMLLRVRPDEGRYQVLVGPYVSTDEAEHAQRKLAAWGLGEARLVVDDAMRARPQQASLFGLASAASNTVVMVAAAGMSSIVFEMTAVPKQVEVRRTGITAVDVEIGQGAGGREQGAGGGRLEAAGNFEPLRLPDGVALVRELSVQSDASGSMRAHLVVPEGVEHRLRLEGRRVYLDLAFPKAPWSIPHVAPPAKAPVKAVAAEPSDDRAQLKAAAVRFDQISAFVASAIASPEADVLAALTHSLDDLRASVEKLTVNGDVERERVSLLAAITQACDEMKKAGGLSTTGPNLNTN
jgi:hypothetical protein